jgi:hypothetical protein
VVSLRRKSEKHSGGIRRKGRCVVKRLLISLVLVSLVNIASAGALAEEEQVTIPIVNNDEGVGIPVKVNGDHAAISPESHGKKVRVVMDDPEEELVEVTIVAPDGSEWKERFVLQDWPQGGKVIPVNQDWPQGATVDDDVPSRPAGLAPEQCRCHPEVAAATPIDYVSREGLSYYQYRAVRIRFLL